MKLIQNRTEKKNGTYDVVVMVMVMMVVTSSFLTVHCQVAP